jgi:hypothetical protein
VKVAQAAGARVEADGYSRPYLAAIAYGSATYGFLAVLLSAFIATRLVGSGEGAALIVWAGTPLPFYMYLAPGMAHACSAFAVTLFVAVWLLVRRRWSTRGLVALGALAALMTMVREQDAFFVSGVALDYLWTHARRWRTTSAHELRQQATALAVGISAAVITFLPQAWAYMVLNGRLGPAQVVSAKMRWDAPHTGQVLFSPEHGLFVWTPLALVCIAGVATSIITHRRREVPDADVRQILVCLLLMFAAQVYISGSVDTWTVAGSFGQRRFLGASVVLVVGMAALLHRAAGWRRVALGAIAIASVWWNIGLMVQFGAGMMDRQRLEPARNAYNTFVRLPAEMPGIVYRYLFDRASFYQPPRAIS